ncbi:MAG: ATP-binding protein [bacterium]
MNDLSKSERLDVAGQIAGQIAHDFNNLLTPLLAYPELIRQEVKQNPLVNEYLGIIEKTADEMQILTQRLLALARRTRVGSEVFCVNDVIIQVIRSLKATTPPGIKVEYDVDTPLLNMAGSRAQLLDVLENIYQNAVEAMGSSGKFQIKTESVHLDEPVGDYGTVNVGDYVKITLLDTGAGIPDEIRKKIFDPFFTTKRANKKRGSGLGLSIVYGIVKDHKGYVDFESTLGQGTVFFLYFPIAQGIPRGETAASVPKVSERRLSGNVATSGAERRMAPRILVVDDEQMIRKLFGMIIKSEFREALIDQASNGDEAVAIFKKGYHDLIIMDLQMPGQDGRESFFAIQQICHDNNYPLPPIIFCTGFTPSESLVEIIKDSSNHCLLRKPVKAESLLEAVRIRLQK